MEDEEEIDIINFDDISKISSGQLLSCDYTVHPKWVNEHAEGGNFWSDSVPKHENLENNVVVLHSEEVVIEEPETKSTILDLEWAGEAATNEYVVFEDDIPAFIEEIVTNEEENDEVNIANQKEADTTLKNDELHCDEPAAFETHPAPKNNKYIGPTNSRSLLKFKIETSPLVSTHPRSLLKISQSSQNKPKTKFKQTLTISSNLFNKRTIPFKKREKLIKTISRTIKPKFKQTLKLKKTNLINNNFKINGKNMKKITKSKSLNSNSSTVSGSQLPHKKNGGKGKSKNKSSAIHFGENITISHENEVTNKKISEANIAPHSVVKLENSELSDIEIDVEGEIDNELPPEFKLNLLASPSLTCLSENKNSSSSSESEIIQRQALNQKSKIKHKKSNSRVSVCEMTEALSHKLRDIQIPKKELEIDANIISDLEKYIHSEFFEGRLTKTPEQYLRIRNHIIGMWIASGKTVYISKTGVRNGLKHGGDVNCISRIHRLLEQIGAINFGFQKKYFEYVRPLEEYMSMFIQTNRVNTNINSSEMAMQSSISSLSMERRNRTKTNTFIFGNAEETIDNNYTIEHLDGIFRPHATTLNSNEQNNFKRTRHIRTELDLVKCVKFSKDNLAPFKVSITLSTLLCIQFHSLSNVNERMGFLGGHRSKIVGRTKISLTKYKPCRTSEQSGTMCEMCPISQLEQSSNLKAEGFELLGWFHSHPLFPPNPSHTDVQTQKEMQLQFSKEKDRPFVGVIFSCLNMAFKCLYVLPKDIDADLNDDAECLPYELDVDIIKDCTNFNNDIKEVFRGIEDDTDVKNIEEIFEKFKSSSDLILQQFGYNSSSFFDGVM